MVAMLQVVKAALVTVALVTCRISYYIGLLLWFIIINMHGGLL
jgi:hypothetical protein